MANEDVAEGSGYPGKKTAVGGTSVERVQYEVETAVTSHTDEEDPHSRYATDVELAALNKRLPAGLMPLASDGEPGDDGPPGAPGRIGVDGAQGPPGPTGADGTRFETVWVEEQAEPELGLIPGPTGPEGSIPATKHIVGGDLVPYEMLGSTGSSIRPAREDHTHHTEGTWANRPAATAVKAGDTYRATNIGSGVVFISNGTIWLISGPQTIHDATTHVVVANTAVETTLITVDVPANFCVAGTKFRYLINGQLDHRATAENFVLKTYLGATSCATRNMAADAVLRTDQDWYQEGWFSVVSSGAGGTYEFTSHSVDMASNVYDPSLNVITTPVAVDTTATVTIKITITMVANAANITRLFAGCIELVRYP